MGEVVHIHVPLLSTWYYQVVELSAIFPGRGQHSGGDRKSAKHEPIYWDLRPLGRRFWTAIKGMNKRTRKARPPCPP